ncbi:hypothetical protein [Amycolatopsis sp. CA-128772]|uniref:hypothetical protein n=1 Tax=Amycolatopsis sp. CA-128772 TaxID=2073159 RepID=UPI000CD1EC2A|nr:hypothetical protein [Amycolatopsis sp. CA-128772]
MAGDRNGCGGCALVVLAVFGGLPLTMVLAAPAIAARIASSGAPALAPYLAEWRWAMIASPLLALVLVRLVLARDGRLRGRSVRPGKRWLGLLGRAGVLLAVVNVAVFAQLTRAGRTDHVIADGLPLFVFAALAGIAVLVAIARWDRRPDRVTVEQIRVATAEADRALRRVRAENERVRRQGERVQARLANLRTRPAGRVDVAFPALRTFHRESYQCADTAHVAYQSAQASLRTMSYVVRRSRYTAPNWLPGGRRARAELRAAAAQLARSHGELRVQVDQGLTMVRTLNANTSELKHEIRDSCGEPGRQWFEALEARIAEARASRAG